MEMQQKTCTAKVKGLPFYIVQKISVVSLHKCLHRCKIKQDNRRVSNLNMGTRKNAGCLQMQ